MSEENPSAGSEVDDASKAETIRITLPPKQEQQAVKRETVRINLPGRPVLPAGTTPKKETTKLPAGAVPPAAPSAPSLPGVPSAPTFKAPTAPPAIGSRPGVPPPPRPLGSAAAGVPSMTPAPPSLSKPAPPSAPGLTPAPKPPSMGGARPAAPMKPAPVAAAPAPKTAAPKKETARITLPPEGTAKPALPKATVKMGMTQPLASRPSQIASVPAIATMAAAPALADSGAEGSGSTLMAVFALAISIVSFVLVLLAFGAANS